MRHATGEKMSALLNLGDMQPIMAAEDFAFMIKGRPGCYILIGNGAGEGTCDVHNPNYNFNDDAILFGDSY